MWWAVGLVGFILAKGADSFIRWYGQWLEYFCTLGYCDIISIDSNINKSYSTIKLWYIFFFWRGGGDFKLIYTTNYTFYTLSYKDQEEGDITYVIILAVIMKALFYVIIKKV